MVGQRHGVVEADLDGRFGVLAVGRGRGASALGVGARGRGPRGARVELAQDVSSVVVGGVEAAIYVDFYFYRLSF